MDITKGRKVTGDLSSIDKNENITGNLSPILDIDGNITRITSVGGSITYSNGQGNYRDYNYLINKPQIESVELIGDKSFEQLGLSEIDTSDILNILI